MKVLWVISSVLPEIGKDCGIKHGVSGGWLTGAADALLENESVDLTVCFCYENDEFEGTVGKLKYYSFKTDGFYRYSKNAEIRLNNIISNEKPDIIHVFGTEYPHSLATLNVAENHGLLNGTVVSIQGLVSVIAKHYFSQLPKSLLHKNTIHDFLKRDSIYGQRNKFIKRGKYEIEALKKAQNVIGRTDWDEACTKSINENLNYFHCNETLRKEFYSGLWNFDSCEKHSIFIGGCSYPIKGFHCILEMMPQILKKYPDARIYVPGQSPVEVCKFSNFLHRTYYQVYLKKIIRKYQLEDRIFFMGNLSASEMKERMIKSNVYILLSSIENSPNTLGEAMLLGVPCIASDVGGVRNLAEDKKDALIYPFEESYMLPYYIDQIFGDEHLAKKISESARSHASVTHNQAVNNDCLLNIYKKLLRG